MGERQDTGGLATVLALMGASASEVGRSSGQDDFFENVDAPLPLPAKGTSGPKGGRPAGARNRSTDEWVRLFLAQHRAPLTVLGNIMSQPLGELVDQLQEMADKHKKWRETADGGYWSVVQVDPLAVLKLQLQAATAAAPYIHKQQPKAIEIDRPQRGVMILGELGGDLELQSDEVVLPLPPLEQKQQVAPAARPQSDDVRALDVGNDMPSNGLAFRDE